MPVIKVRENEPFDVALRRFKRSCEKAGILADVRNRETSCKEISKRECTSYSLILIYKLVFTSYLYGMYALKIHTLFTECGFCRFR